MSTRPLANSADARSLELHREVARRLVQQPELLEQARTKVDVWQAQGTLHPEYADAWRELLRRGVSAVVAVLEDPGERGQALRQVSPFTHVLAPRLRWKLLREVSRGQP